MTNGELTARLNNLYAMLEEEGCYTKANTVSLVIDHIEKLEKGIQEAVALANRPHYGYLHDALDNCYEAISSLKELVEK